MLWWSEAGSEKINSSQRLTPADAQTRGAHTHTHTHTSSATVHLRIGTEATTREKY
jgi:hypothetical protein